MSQRSLRASSGSVQAERVVGKSDGTATPHAHGAQGSGQVPEGRVTWFSEDLVQLIPSCLHRPQQRVPRGDARSSVRSAASPASQTSRARAHVHVPLIAFVMEHGERDRAWHDSWFIALWQAHTRGFWMDMHSMDARRFRTRRARGGDIDC